MKFPKTNLIKVGGKTIEPLGGTSLLLSGLSQVPVPHPYPSSDSTAQLPACMAQIHLLEHHLARTDTIFSASAARLRIFSVHHYGISRVGRHHNIPGCSHLPAGGSLGSVCISGCSCTGLCAHFFPSLWVDLSGIVGLLTVRG